MDIHTVRRQLRSETIYDLPLRVTFYARVSSESDEQLNSLGNQISYYRELITGNANWRYIPGYIDEGLSAATTRKRENFHRMIADGRQGLFDLIITKEITRFARNTLDSILYTRELLSAGVGGFFQNDNIYTLDEDSELRLTIMSGIAQDELRKLSSRVKFGHQQAIKKNVVLGNSRIFGYTKDHGRLLVDTSEAAMVRELFELYATGEYSMKKIENLFWERGYRNHNGGRILHTTMSGMIANPKYKGYYVGNKVSVVDLFTKKQKFLPREEWVMFRDESGRIVPAIVSEALWDQANAILKKRSEDVKRRRGICNHENLLTGKLYCARCSAPYYRRDCVDRRGGSNSRWVCSGKIKNGAEACPSFPIYEHEIKALLLDVFREAEADTEALIEEYIGLLEVFGQSGELAGRIGELERIIETAQKKRQKLLTFNALGELPDNDFLTMSAQCAEEIASAQNTLGELKTFNRPADELRRRTETVRRALSEAAQSTAAGIIDRDFVDRYIEGIFAEPQDDGSMLLRIRTCTGETAERSLRKFGSRTGHTFKKMIQSYENNIQ